MASGHPRRAATHDSRAPRVVQRHFALACVILSLLAVFVFAFAINIP